MISVGLLRRTLAVLVLEAMVESTAVAGDTSRVLMRSITFEPKQVTVHLGDTIEWVNQDVVAHTATATDRSWDVNVQPGHSGRLVMKRAGTFSYICRYHPNMTGEVTVEP